MPSPSPHVYLFENHDQAYHIWRGASLRDRVVLHLDAHDDLEWIKKDQPIHIGNYLCAAVREGIAREIIWVVPGRSFESPGDRKRLMKRVRQLVRQYPSPRAEIRCQADGIFTSLLGKPLHVVCLRSLPVLKERVLLDIDVDFLTSPSAVPPESAGQGIPWCWPRDLADELSHRGADAEAVTIAWSVEGGYTPLRWKYLGEELRDRLGGASNPAWEKLREAAISLERGDVASAEAGLRAIPLVESAAACYHLARLLRAQGRLEEARAEYRQAVERDPSYATAYNNRGPEYWRRRRFELAEQEYREALLLDDNDAYAHFGMAQIACHRRQWGDAEAELRKALQEAADLPDAWTVLGDVLAMQGRQKEAIAACSKFLALTLQGKRTLRSPLMTVTTGQLDIGHASAHAKMARAQERIGDLRTAAQGYRLSIAANRDRASTRWRLARVLVRQGKWGEALGHVVAGVGRIPADLRRKCAALLWRLRAR